MKIKSVLFLIISFQISSTGKNIITNNDTVNCFNDTVVTNTKTEESYIKRIQDLDTETPINLVYNQLVCEKIEKYINKEKRLISKMLTLKEYYFPIFEEELDKNNLPLELKYLAIVESALNPKARSKSGASGLWQFMYRTGKEYGLNVTSYKDERQDPYKSTKAACKYFIKLYDMFGDWSLVLAAYNAGPGYIQRKIAKTNQNDYWGLHPHLKKETQNYVPLFIAVNYIMNHYEKHDIQKEEIELNLPKTDTITLKKQVEFRVLEELLCVSEEMISYLNPQYKTNILPREEFLVIPREAAQDFALNDSAYYVFINAVEQKEILINEKRVEYFVREGDYLGKIAIQNNIFVHQIKSWNNLTTTNIDVGDKLILYIKENVPLPPSELLKNKKEYIIQKGDTLWEIAQKHTGLSVSKIKEYNNLDTDLLKPGAKIILPL